MARKSTGGAGKGRPDDAPLAKLDLPLRKLVQMRDSAIRAELKRAEK